jgi:hypothetical protein
MLLPALIPAFLFFFTFLFYLRTHCASFNINDSGETIMVCDQLTISHSPGYPLHTLWGRVNCLLPLGEPMLRVTFSSMVTATLSVVFVYWILRMLLQSVFIPADSINTIAEDQRPGPWLWEIPSVFGALVFAFSYQQWFQACGAKGGIYTLNTLLTVAMLYLFFKMRERSWFIKSFLLMGFLYGLSLAHHWPNQFVMAPAYLWFFFSSQKRVPFKDVLTSLLRPFDLWEKIRNIVSAFGSVNFIRVFTLGIISLSVYLYLPLRAIQDPIINWWDPRTLDRLWGTVIRKGYLGTGDVHGMATYVRNLKRFWMHAEHQFGGGFTFVLYALAIWGFIWLWNKKQRKDALGLSILGAGVFFGIILFNNPLEGYQWTIDNFFTPVFLVVAMFAAAGIAGLCEAFSKKWPNYYAPLVISAFCLSFASMPLILNYMATDKVVDGQTVYQSVDQSRYVSSYDEGMNMLKTVNRDGVIICNGDIDILPLWYLQHVEHKRPEVVVFTMQLIPYDWFREPLFKKFPFLKVPVGYDVRPETVVQDMINMHAQDRSFYFTNIFTAPWMQKDDPAVPEGFLWRIVKTKNLDYAFTSRRLNVLWATYRLRDMEAPERGYWDEYTDVMKDSYGIGYDFTGYFSLINKMPDVALWSFNNALKYRQPQTQSRIYAMLGETYMALSRPQSAVNSFQMAIQKGAQDSHIFARLGDAFSGMSDFSDAQSAYRTSLNINPQDAVALAGVSMIEKIQNAHGGKDKRS